MAKTPTGGGPTDTAGSGTGYLVLPDGERGRGVLVLHSWWGLTQEVKQWCDDLADAGYVAFAPDLFDGALPQTAAEAQLVLEQHDPNKGAALVLSSARTLRTQCGDPRLAVGVIGFSMGASWALWLSVRSPHEVAGVAAYYGTQSIDFEGATSSYLFHFAETDDLVTDDEAVEMEAHMRLGDLDVDAYTYAGTHHFFAEQTPDDTLEPRSAELAARRTYAFLDRALQPPPVEDERT